MSTGGDRVQEQAGRKALVGKRGEQSKSVPMSSGIKKEERGAKDEFSAATAADG